MPTSSRKLLRTVDPKERPCIATSQNSAHTTPVCATPVCATPARATPARATPARATPSRATPPRPTQATSSHTTPARPTPSRTTPARTTPPPRTCSTSANPQTSLEQDPARESQSLPGQHEHDQLQSPRLARALFSGQQNGSTGGMDRRERDTPSCQTPAPTAPASQTDLDDTAVGFLTAELDTVALSDRQLDEYLEHFDWEEIGEYGDEDTVGIWSTIFETPRLTNTDSIGTAEGENESNSISNERNGVDENCTNAGGEDATSNERSSPCNDLPFTTTRLGSHKDTIPPPNRQPYPPYNNLDFPQQQRLTGIRARKTRLASLVTNSSDGEAQL
ncbi:hypothetical protein AM587_10002616 [Phytophthora nicotianae]|uniref:Uncharacterized protein n=1 Tax=Phytophthora nicotianae TaxID=4792 RepID=A0A0W8C1T0_PHYNI|nr:hypothetical protein AM587_10002616 [Phytophthora nicotianae]